jgi:hypothetical protein
MSFHAFPSHSRVLCIFAAAALAVGAAWGLSDQARARQLSAMGAKFPNAEKQSALCTNCARLSVNICSIPGYGCPPCDDVQEFLEVVAILDPDFWIKNHGNLASNPGTLTVQLHDLRGSGLITTVIPIPAIAAGADTFVTIQTNGLLFKASEGVTLTLDYTDSAGTRHNVRKATKCPDN